MPHPALTDLPLARTLAQIAAILVVSRVLGVVMRRVGQPMVLAEISAGIVLGPSILGVLAPGLAGELFTADSLAGLHLFSQLGLVLFMFLVGLQVDPSLLREHRRAAAAVSIGSIVVPLVLGAALAWNLHPRLIDSTIPIGSFSLFVGTAMCASGFSVLARFLTERRMLDSVVGTVALASAAFEDVAVWCLVAVVIAVERSDGWGSVLATVALTIAFVSVMLLAVQPLLRRLGERVTDAGTLRPDALVTVLVLLFASALTTEIIGVHALFGAFVFGVVLPTEGDLRRHLTTRLESLVLTLLLPVFFAYSGVRTELGLLVTPADWLACAAIVAVGFIGKFAGSAVAAQLAGLGFRDSATLGILMNTRGLKELIILNIGLDLGVISPTAFVMLVVMGLVTTALTAPLLRLLGPTAAPEDGLRDLGPAVRDADAFRILVCVASGRSGPGLVSVASALGGGGSSRPEVDALHLSTPGDHASFVRVDAEADLADRGLGPLLDRARALDLTVKPMSFVSTDPSEDICRIALVKRAGLVLMGWHRPLLSQALLGGVVHGVLKNAGSVVGVFVDRGMTNVRRVLVPFRESPHDRAALGLAWRIATQTNAEVVVLDVRVSGAERSVPDAAKRAVNDVFASKRARVDVRVVDSASPVDFVLDESRKGYDLVVVGVGRTWGLESGFLGLQPERLMQHCPVSLLVVRGALGAHAVASMSA